VALDWVTISSLATAGGTLVLAVATFSSVRSANRTASAAERSLQVGLRPVLMPSRRDDEPQKIMYGDEKWVKIPGGAAVGEVENEVVYLAMSLRNAGSGLAVLHGWYFHPSRQVGIQDHAPPEEFRSQARDMYVPPGDTGFWQGALRDKEDPAHGPATEAVGNRTPVAIDLLYGDHEGGQRVITRFTMAPRDDGTWLPSVVRHWNVDRPDPR
jgi:hypothetical protein